MLLTCLEAKVPGLWRKRICHRCRPRRGIANTAMACDDDSMTFLPRDRRIGSSKKHCHTFMRHFTGGQMICRYLLSPILLFLQGQFGLSIHQRQGRPWNHMLRWQGGRFACQKYHPAGHCGAKGQQSSSGHRDIPRLKGGNVFCFKYFKCGFA